MNRTPLFGKVWPAKVVPSRTYYMWGGGTMEDWVYFAGLYDSKFEAYCAVMWIEADERIRGTISPGEVQVYQTRRGKFGVRFRQPDEIGC